MAIQLYTHTQEYVGRFSDFKPDLSTKDIYNKITIYKNIFGLIYLK